MTNQEIFDKVATHLFAQGQRAIAGYTCMYRTRGGLKCAIGCLIPDEVYDLDMEGLSVDQIFDFPKICDLFKDNSIDLLENLQIVHDNDAFNSSDLLRNSLARVALDFDLDPEILKHLSLSCDQ